MAAKVVAMTVRLVAQIMGSNEFVVDTGVPCRDSDPAIAAMHAGRRYDADRDPLEDAPKPALPVGSFLCGPARIPGAALHQDRSLQARSGAI